MVFVHKIHILFILFKMELTSTSIFLGNRTKDFIAAFIALVILIPGSISKVGFCNQKTESSFIVALGQLINSAIPNCPQMHVFFKQKSRDYRQIYHSELGSNLLP